MAEAKLRAHLEESMAEIVTLKHCGSPDVPTVDKDLSLISLVTKRSGAKNFVPLDEFLAA